MAIDEGMCPKCKKLLWASEEELICPYCSGYEDISNEKMNRIRNSIKLSLQIMNNILSQISYNEIIRISINSLEHCARSFKNIPYNLEGKFNLISEWMKFSLNLSYLKSYKQNDNNKIINNKIIEKYLQVLHEFAKNFILLIKISLGNIHYFKDNNIEIILTSPTKPLFSTPNSVLKIQNKKAYYPTDLKHSNISSIFYSFIDANLYETQFYRLVGNYLAKGLGLPKYIISNNKNEALNLLSLYSKLHDKLKFMPVKNSHVFNKVDFIYVFGKDIYDKLLHYIEFGNFSYEENIYWTPLLFLYFNSEEKILPLFFSNQIFEEILLIKTGKTKSGNVANLKGNSFEDDIFGYVETLNVTGIVNGKKLIRVSNPLIDSNLKELADVIFIGNQTNTVYIISAKSHSVLTLQTLLNELTKYCQEQDSIKEGLNYLNISTKNLCWLFITPITWINSFHNIKIFDVLQMASFICHKEGFKTVYLQNENETLKLKDFNKYGDFTLNNRFFRIDIGKIHDKMKNEITIWIPVEKVNFTLISIDVPKFINTDYLKIGSWISILFEYRTKYSTQAMSFHDAEIIDYTHAFSILKKMNIQPPYP